MKLTWRYVLYLCWVSFAFTSSILLFCQGFLLYKIIIPKKSSSSVNCFGSVKIVAILIDALRYDFIAPGVLGEKPYTGILGAELPSEGKLYKFIVDPPTTTLQRLYALTTGSLPTFVDIRSSFNALEISEDNLIDQISSNVKGVVFIGDDTWSSLYPGRFTRYFPYPSFNVWDLDTVDHGVITHLIPEMSRSNWSIILGHFLGVDHCGHRYAPVHPEMTRKLTEMKTVVHDVVEAMDNETILFVFGDHGMTENGDHGGETELETSSALFVYSKNSTLMKFFPNVDSVQQIDLVPTISLILGVPIPFSNLGASFLEVGPESNDPRLQCSFLGLWQNVEQVRSYLNEYSKINSQFSSTVHDHLNRRIDLIGARLSVSNKFDPELAKEMRQVLKDALELCRQVWVQFDFTAMVNGLTALILLTLLSLIIVEFCPSNSFQEDLSSKFLLFVVVSVIMSSVACFILSLSNIVGSLEISLYFSICFVSLVLLGHLILKNKNSILEQLLRLHKHRNTPNVITCLIFLISVIGLFSNSFIIEESSVMPFLLFTLVWISVMAMKVEKRPVLRSPHHSFLDHLLSKPKGKAILLTLLFSIIIRLSFYYWQCRDEQMRNCRKEKSLSKTIFCLLTIVSFSVFVVFVKLWMRSMGNLVGLQPSVVIARYLPSINVVCCGCYWVLNSLPSKVKPKLFLSWQIQLFPQAVFFISLIALALVYTSPLCIHLALRPKYYGETVIPTIFKSLKKMMVGNNEEEQPTSIYGLATVYSAAFTNLMVFSCFLCAIVFQEWQAVVIALMATSLVLLSIISAVVRSDRPRNKGNYFAVPWWSIVAWHLSSYHFFYATGHQASFLSIQWMSAGLFGDITSTVVPGIIVLLNTFSSQIVHSLLLPGLAIIPYTLRVASPSLVPNASDLRNGELEIFQLNDMRRHELFSLISRFTLLNILRIFVSMFAAYIHARHLMVWAIFAPKLIFEITGFLVSLPFLLMGYLLVERISTKINQVISSLPYDN